ncbi:ABC transporter substrate-binding protein [Anaerocolumna sp. AGMB13025]|uniref:ABC transporter substrate-binding protein n=1 Tax=Anaerocolumna sp. AGMB13025 TaxID=3039116 RepID=UPI00241C17DB|nr:ABC transporter substrate-binding protein [Anaerocolumna sp. AGMB13025]WFR59597.1 ABC transporter substrate-binding protein [Anaerocolumna sp. AGMB13025]
MKRKVLSILLVLCMVLSLAGCKSKDATKTASETEATDNTAQSAEATPVPDKVEATGQYDTLVIGTDAFNGVFNPMFSFSAFDNQVTDMVFSTVSWLDKTGAVVDNAGHVEAEEVPAADGHTQVKYTVSIKPGMTFSDGQPVTIDDVLFYYYVCADPTYDGSSTFSTLDIVGLKDYYYDTPDYNAQLEKITKEAKDKYSLDKISEEDYKAYLRDTKLAGWWEGIDSYDWVTYLKGEGYDPTGIEKDENKLFEMMVDCEYTKYHDGYDPQSYYQKKLENEYIKGNLEDGVDVPEISGITRVDDNTCTVLFDSPNISGDKQVAWIPIIPKHYYGADFTKGKLDGIKSFNGTPLGGGPYKYVSYQDNIVSLEANPTYFKGAPKIPNLKFQVVSNEDKVDAVINGDIDITEPSASKEVVEQIESAGMEYSLVDNPGYGYIAISSERVPDLNVRKGLMHLLNRAPAVESYYGELAKVIERPMTPTVAEYPHDAKEVYGYDPTKALDYFTKAGYKKDSSGKLSKGGQPLKITIGIGGDGTMNHPSAPILTQMANDLKSMGGELVIQDLDPSTLFSMFQSGELDMWVAAWGNATDCDLTQMFGSKGNDNDVKLNSPDVDKLQAEILKTVDFNERCKLVAQELDLIMDAAVYMPVYQRKNMLIYNSNTVKTDTLPAETTTYWDYTKEIEKLEMN